MDMTLAPLESDPSIEHLTLTEARARTAEELIRFQSGSYIEFSGQKPARLRLGMEIRNLHLGLFTLFGGLDLDGTWQAKSDSFALQARAHTHQLFINDYELGEGLVLIDYYKGVLKFPAPTGTPALVTGSIDFHAAPQLTFTNFFISGYDRQGLELSGQIGPSLWDFKMVGHGLDMGILWENWRAFLVPHERRRRMCRCAEQARQPILTWKGPLSSTEELLLGLAFPQRRRPPFIWQDARDFIYKTFALSDPGRYTLGRRRRHSLSSPKHKTPQPGGPLSIDFSVRLLNSNLSLLQSFMPEVKQAKGGVDGLLQIKGTLEEPSMHGSLHVTNGDVLGAHYFRQLRNASSFD